MRINGIGVVPSYKKITDTYSEKCPTCHNVVVFQLVETVNKFTIYWIPIAKWNKKYYIICPVCDHGQNISTEKAEELRASWLRKK